MSSLKERKEQFVTGFSGSSVHEVYVVTSVSLVSFFCFCIMKKFTNVFKELTVFSITLDYLLNWVMLLLSVTIYSQNILMLNYSVVVPVIFMALVMYSTSQTAKSKQIKYNNTMTKAEFLPRKGYLTVYRSQMLVITSIAILAVDFQVFPRQFVKCETWGTSLMDLGVGSFVFSMGIVSARSSIWSKYNTKSSSFSAILVDLLRKIVLSVKNSFTVFCLGIGRLVLVKALNYQEHVSEYGVHWNFFVTLSLLQPAKYLSEFFFSLLNLNVSSLAIGICTSALFDKILSANISYLLSEERTTLIDKNKEGIYSLVGYISIFLVGEATGGFLLPAVKTPYNLLRNATKSEITDYYSGKMSLWAKYTTFSSDVCLIVYAVIVNGLSYISKSQVSRRFANFPYVLFVCSYNLNFLVGFKLIDRLFRGDNVPYSLESVNNNGLLMFLISNVGTGLVNMGLNTLDSSQNVAISVLVGYTVILAVVAQTLNHYEIYIKL